MRKKLINNIIGTILTQVASIIISFIIPRLIIATYGSTLNGLTSTITSIISYLALLEGGLSVSSSICLYKPLIDGDFEKINEIYTAIDKYYKKIGFIFSGGTLIFAIIASFSYLKSVDFFVCFPLVIFMGTSNIFTFFFSGKYNVILIADEKSYIKNYLVMGGKILGTIIQYFVIVNGLPFLLSQFVVNFAIVFSAIPLLLYIGKYYPKLKYNKESNFKISTSNKNDALLIQISNVIKKGAPAIIISYFLGLEFASVYSIYALLFHTGNSFLETLSQSVTSIYGKKMTKDKGDSINSLYNTTELIIQCFIAFLFIGFFSVTIPFIEIYIGAADLNYKCFSLLIIFILSEWFNGASFASYTLLMAKGSFNSVRKAYLYDAIATVFLGILGCLTAKYIIFPMNIIEIGDCMAGTLTGYLVGSIMRFLLLNIYCNKIILKKNIMISLGKSFVSLFALIALSFVIKLINFESASGYFQLIVHAIIIVIPFSLFMFIVLSLIRFKTIKEIIRKVSFKK